MQAVSMAQAQPSAAPQVVAAAPSEAQEVARARPSARQVAAEAQHAEGAEVVVVPRVEAAAVEELREEAVAAEVLHVGAAAEAAQVRPSVAQVALLSAVLSVRSGPALARRRTTTSTKMFRHARRAARRVQRRSLSSSEGSIEDVSWCPVCLKKNFQVVRFVVRRTATDQRTTIRRQCGEDKSAPTILHDETNRHVEDECTLSHAAKNAHRAGWKLRCTRNHIRI